MTNDKFRAAAAFTLIELLVVIAIIAILAAMIMAAIVRAKEKVRMAKVKLDTRGIEQAVHSYVGAYGPLPVSPNLCLNLPSASNTETVLRHSSET